jgi:hypothetical protein
MKWEDIVMTEPLDKIFSQRRKPLLLTDQWSNVKTQDSETQLLAISMMSLMPTMTTLKISGTWPQLRLLLEDQQSAMSHHKSQKMKDHLLKRLLPVRAQARLNQIWKKENKSDQVHN